MILVLITALRGHTHAHVHVHARTCAHTHAHARTHTHIFACTSAHTQSHPSLSLFHTPSTSLPLSPLALTARAQPLSSRAYKDKS